MENRSVVDNGWAEGLSTKRQCEFLGKGNCLSCTMALDTQLYAFVTTYRTELPKE